MQINQVLVDSDLVARCVDELKLALSQFGTYTFDDKGPQEVMNIDDLVEEFRDLSPEAAGNTLLALAADITFWARAETLASCILGEMEDWDELWEVPGVDEIY